MPLEAAKFEKVKKNYHKGQGHQHWFYLQGLHPMMEYACQILCLYLLQFRSYGDG